MNFYDLFAISREATPEEIKIAFRNKAVLCHPDKGGSDEEFNKVRVAYETLMDEEKRRIYDLTGEADPNFHPDKDGHDLAKAIVRKIGIVDKNDILTQAISFCVIEIQERKKVQNRLNEQNDLIISMKGKFKPKIVISEESQEKVDKKEFDEEVIDELLEANEEKEKINIFDEVYDELKIEVEAEISRISKAVLVAETALKILQNYEPAK